MGKIVSSAVFSNSLSRWVMARRGWMMTCGQHREFNDWADRSLTMCKPLAEVQAHCTPALLLWLWVRREGNWGAQGVRDMYFLLHAEELEWELERLALCGPLRLHVCLSELWPAYMQGAWIMDSSEQALFWGHWGSSRMTCPGMVAELGLRIWVDDIESLPCARNCEWGLSLTESSSSTG
jgi:hypothetical protein